MNDSDATPGTARGANRTAEEFRASLERRREADDLLSEARAARQAAIAEAVEIVRVAESMARVIEDAARVAAQTTLAEATARSEQVVARAREQVVRLLIGDEPPAPPPVPDPSPDDGVGEPATPESHLATARRDIDALQEAALAEVAAQQRHAQAAFQEQIGITIGRLESMASDVQLVVDRAMSELTESLSPLAERPSAWTPDPGTANGDGPRSTESWHERWRSLFRPPR